MQVDESRADDASVGIQNVKVFGGRVSFAEPGYFPFLHEKAGGPIDILGGVDNPTSPDE
jgi:hypothetical protein